jgi:hypothetical protein
MDSQTGLIEHDAMTTPSLQTNATSGFGSTVALTTAMGRTSSFQTTLALPWIQTSTSTFSEQHTNTWTNGLQATSGITKSVGDLCNLVRGSSPRPKSDPSYYGGSIPRLMIEDITRDG